MYKHFRCCSFADNCAVIAQATNPMPVRRPRRIRTVEFHFAGMISRAVAEMRQLRTSTVVTSGQIEPR
jgi:hypothetical protein